MIDARKIFEDLPFHVSEASFALTAFGVLTGLASPAHQAPTPLGTILLANFLRLVATLALGILLGWGIVKCSECQSQ